MKVASCLSMLNPARCSLDRIRGGISQLSWEDISSALAMGSLSKCAYYLGRLTFCDDLSVYQALIEEMEQAFKEFAKLNGWKITNEKAYRLSRLACREVMSNAMCNSCQGEGIFQKKSCNHCNGKGYKRMSERSKYQFAGIDKRNWERRWQERYEWIYQFLIDEYEGLEQHLRKQLY